MSGAILAVTLWAAVCVCSAGVAVWFREAVRRKEILYAMVYNDAESKNARLQGLLYEAAKEQPQTTQEYLDENRNSISSFERGLLEFTAAEELENKKLFDKMCDSYGSSL